jgi:hypothetical protein
MVTSVSRPSWHRWLVVQAYNSFGQQTIPEFDRLGYVAAVIVSTVFVACAGVICLVLNAGSLLFGIVVEPIWTGRDRFRVLKLPGNIPLVLVVLPVLIAYGMWRTIVSYGVLVTLAPFVVTGLLAVIALATVVAFNTLRRRMSSGPL